MKPLPCKHLDYEGPFDGCELRTLAPHYPEVRYWERGPAWTDGGYERDVQFCRLYGRVSGKLRCYLGELGCYEPEEVK